MWLDTTSTSLNATNAWTFNAATALSLSTAEHDLSSWAISGRNPGQTLLHHACTCDHAVDLHGLARNAFMLHEWSIMGPRARPWPWLLAAGTETAKVAGWCKAVNRWACQNRPVPPPGRIADPAHLCLAVRADTSLANVGVSTAIRSLQDSTACQQVV